MAEGQYPRRGKASSRQALLERNRMIRKDFAEGLLSQAQIGRKYSLTRQRINQIVRSQDA